jgi:hypothetical protein
MSAGCKPMRWEDRAAASPRSMKRNCSLKRRREQKLPIEPANASPRKKAIREKRDHVDLSAMPQPSPASHQAIKSRTIQAVPTRMRPCRAHKNENGTWLAPRPASHSPIEKPFNPPARSA